MLSLRNISKSFDGKTVLRDISFNFPERAVTALRGPSGCGKTTLVNIILGLLAPDVVRDGAAFVREHYLSTCRRAEKLPSDSKKDARMREMFVLNLDWFMATLLEGSVAEG